MIDIKNAYAIKNNHYIFKDICLNSNAKTIAISGANGVGKSTFLLQFMGINTKADKFCVMNEDLLKNANIKDFALIYQDAKSSINPLFDIGRLMLFLARDKNISNVKEKTLNLCEQFKLKDIWHSYSHELSIGEAKKTSLIFALIKEPKLLILDELTAGLDEASVKIILDFLKKLDINMIFSSHDLRFLDICDELYEFNKAGLNVIRN